MPRKYVGKSGRVHYDSTLQELCDLVCLVRRASFERTKQYEDAKAEDAAERERTGSTTQERAFAVKEEAAEDIQMILAAFTGLIPQSEAEDRLGREFYFPQEELARLNSELASR